MVHPPVERAEGELDEEAPEEGHHPLPGDRLGLGFEGVHGGDHQSRACSGHTECVSGEWWWPRLGFHWLLILYELFKTPVDSKIVNSFIFFAKYPITPPLQK